MTDLIKELRMSTETATTFTNAAQMISDANQLIEPAPYCPASGWCVEEFIPKNGQVLVTGSNRGSNRLLAMDLSLSVAAGIPALGCYRTCQGPVLYVPWGDASSVGETLPAWIGWRGVDVDSLTNWGFQPCTSDLTKMGSVKSLIRHCRRWLQDCMAGQPLSLLVLDSPAKLKPASLTRLREELGCSVLVTRCGSDNAVQNANTTYGPLDVILHLDHPPKQNATHLVLDRLVPLGQPLKLTLRKAKSPDGSTTRVLWPTR
jgi:hypothetical protein